MANIVWRMLLVLAIVVTFGCEAEQAGNPLGDSCEVDTECEGENVCVNGKCSQSTESPTGDDRGSVNSCRTDVDCGGNDICVDGQCVERGEPGGSGETAGSGGPSATGGTDGNTDTAGSGGGSSGDGGEGGSTGMSGDGGDNGTGGTGGDSGTAGTGGDSGTAGTGGDSGAGGTDPMVYGVVQQSCRDAGLDCSDESTPASCCHAKLVVGGTFPMGRCERGADEAGCSDYFSGYAGEDAPIDEVPEHNVTVANFYLDTFEVTVGRFRKFVEAYDGTAPPQGAGEHPLIAGSGWQRAWNSNLPATKEELIDNLKCGLFQTWTDMRSSQEQQPINCIDWYCAFAFCIWDGARLPTEAEWEYAAAGGDENRLYPWGSEDPFGDPLRLHPTDVLNPFLDVGSYPSGIGRWGHYDFAGSVQEWVLDWYDELWYLGSGNTCQNCANLNSGAYRIARGESWSSEQWYAAHRLRAARRSAEMPTNPNTAFGFRCAKSP